VIIVCKVLNMDICLTKTIVPLQKAFINPLESMDYFYDGRMCFFYYYYDFLCGRLKEKVIYTQTQDCLRVSK